MYDIFFNNQQNGRKNCLSLRSARANAPARSESGRRPRTGTAACGTTHLRTRAHSSVGQSSGLIIRRSWDHAPLGPLVDSKRLSFVATSFFAATVFRAFARVSQGVTRTVPKKPAQNCLGLEKSFYICRPECIVHAFGSGIGA